MARRKNKATNTARDVSAISGGIAAARDVKIEMSYPGLAAGPYPKEEEEERARFAEFSRICDCPRPVRDIFRELMAEHAFSCESLASAWNHRALSWDGQAGKIVACHSRAEHVMAWSMIGLTLFVWGLSALIYIVDAAPANRIAMVILFWVSSLGLAWLLCDAGTRLFRPRRAALRVMRVLASLGQQAANDKAPS